MLRGASILCLSVLCACVFGQNSPQFTSGTTTSGPIARVYVTSLIAPNSSDRREIYAYLEEPDGRLKAVPGSPFDDNVKDVWGNSHYLFGLDGSVIYSYWMQPGGHLSLRASIDAAHYANNFCGGIGPLKVDHSGQYLYNAIAENDCMGFSFQTFGIDNTNGKLTYKSTSPETFLGGSELDFLGNNHFAYSPVCTFFDGEEVGYITGFRRSSNGALTSITVNGPSPVPQNTSNSYCPLTIATDPTNHLAVLEQEEGPDGTRYNPPAIATFTADASGNLSSASTYQNMVHTFSGSSLMRMSVSGKLLAVGGSHGLEIFHYHGANPTYYANSLLTSGSVQALYWDDFDHLFATEWTADGNGKLYVFTVTLTGAVQAPGSPYPIPNPDSLNVRPE
jgi:hypothetical protein